MKHLNAPRALVLLAAGAFVLTLCTNAQITVQAGDFRNALRTGVSTEGYSTPAGVPVAVNVGTASSSPQVWDFRNFTYEKQTEGVFIDPASAPQHAQFPNADVVQRVMMSSLPGDYSYQYNQITDSEFLLHGLGYSDDTPIYEYKPPSVQVKFPCTLGTGWVYQSDPYSPVPGVTSKSRFTWQCDAHGTLRLPAGDFQALRLLVETVTEVTTTAGSYLIKSYRYNFLTASVAGAYISIDSNDVGRTEVTASSVSYGTISGTSNTDINNAPMHAVLEITAPSPNPVRESSTFELHLAASAPVRVALHDALGRESALLRDSYLQSGSHVLGISGRGLAAGVYFLTARTAGAAAVRKLIVAP